MNERHTGAIIQRPPGNRSLDGEIVSIDLPLFVKQIKQESVWKNGNRNAITVFRTNSLRIVMIAMHEGMEIARHSSESRLSFHVLDGQIGFVTHAQPVELNKGEMLVLHERIPHSVLALKESIFLITLTS